jgi:choline dehydrogenase-like flavoprotein
LPADQNSSTRYDVIVVGSGPGGASLAQSLAKTGKRILMLERGEYLPREEANWSSEQVFVQGRYQAKERWLDIDNRPFAPQLHYFVGGNSKVYGGALFRMRERDFGEVVHSGGISPAWPLDYATFEPWYQAAEQLFEVHGQRGEDPLEPWSTTPYPHPPVSHEPKIAELADSLSAIGLKPFHIPLGIRLDEVDGKATPTSPCIRCSYYDGFPCPMNAKSDAQVICIDPMLAAHGPAALGNVTLLTGAYVSRLLTDATGRIVQSVEVIRNGEVELYSADIVVVAAGALSSALLLLRSGNDAHPAGLANGSDQVGRNYMRHEMSVLMAVMRQPNDTVFQKTLAFSDFYFGSDDWEFPLGLVQLMATSHTEQIKAEVLPLWLEWLPGLPFSEIARHSLDFWLQAEDLPDPANRIYYAGEEVHLDLKPTNPQALDRLKAKLKQVLDRSGNTALLLDRSLYLGQDIGLPGTAHQAGTIKFGTDPATSVLNLDCRAHEVDNLYVTDASFFPSISAVNPTLTIIANALRVADIIAARLA